MSVATITVVGSANKDLVGYCAELPKVGETVKGSKYSTAFGGKGANQAVQAARLGAQVKMVAKLGNDVIGKETKQNFEDNGVDVKHVLFTDKAASGVALIFVDEKGSNSIVIATGANDELTPQEVQAARESIRNSKVVMCQLEVKAEVTIEALKIGREEGVKTILNTAPILPEMPEDLYKYSDLICANETELEKMSGLSVDSLDKIQEAAKVLLKKGVKEVVVTLGERGCLYVTESETKHIPTEKNIKVVDTTGAGDSFIGSFATFVAMGKSIEQSLAAANWVAGYSVQRYGTQPSYAYIKDLPEGLFS